MNPFESNNLINFYQTERAENTSGDLLHVAQGP